MSEELLKQIKELEDKAAKLKKMLETYPDLKEHSNRWKTIRYCSASVNTKVDRVEIGHSCGCCSDPAVVCYPYIETEFGRIYSDPPLFHPGEKSWTGYDVADENWQQIFRNHNISEVVINQIENHFKREAESKEDYEYDSENSLD